MSLALALRLTSWSCSPQAKRNPPEHTAKCVPRALATQAWDQREGEIATKGTEAIEMAVAAPHVGVFISLPHLVCSLPQKDVFQFFMGGTGFHVQW